eukprot:10900070-Lingulodinium_polyedra.AAC.1
MANDTTDARRSPRPPPCSPANTDPETSCARLQQTATKNTMPRRHCQRGASHACPSLPRCPRSK